MAHYGIQAQVAAKTASKRSGAVERALVEWIFQVNQEEAPPAEGGPTYEEILKDGVVLCKLMNKVKPGSIDKVSVLLCYCANSAFQFVLTYRIVCVCLRAL